MSAVGLYVHFPFCRAKCPYCHFASERWDPARAEAWQSGLGLEAGRAGGLGLVFDTIYVGGGTPSLMSGAAVRNLAERLRDLAGPDVVEFTLEANPGRVDPALLTAWKECGVNRLSIGVQSFDDRHLRLLGRGHTAGEAAAFFEACRAAGFENIGVDVMIGLPGEGEGRADEILDSLRRLGPEHVSVYILEETDGLPIEAELAAEPPDEDLTASVFQKIALGLKGLGFEHYEISNFARPGRRCLHNLKYWRYQPFLGLGPSACSRLGSERWCNLGDLDGWARALAEGRDPREEVVALDPGRITVEALVSGLRLREGVRPSDLRARFGLDARERFAGPIAELAGEGWLEVEADRLSVPEERWLLSNFVFARFV
jgi:oxygen-independent coproporphyrinogen-3 oxidase